MGFERRPRGPVLLRAAPCCAVSEVIRLTFKPSAAYTCSRFRIQNSRAVLSLSQTRPPIRAHMVMDDSAN